MAHAERLSSAVLSRLATAMPDFLEGLSDALQPDVSLELRETFQVFLFPLGEILDPAAKPFAARVTRNQQWHLQLYQGEQPVGYVLASGDEVPAAVQAVFLCDLAAAIDAAVQRIDAEAPGDDDPMVHLLFVPSHHLHLLWVRRQDRPFFALSAPLQRDEPYGEKELLTRLREIPPVVGLRPDAA